jgi:T6SS, Phospholipase effector Tle1-like, catalytic domain
MIPALWQECAMAKNIVIFSDGTGQAGGINFDEARTNVYKLYRACRVGPDTPINPAEQVAFYDPGLGSAADGSQFKIGWMRWIYNLLSMATGLGITNNIIDCYAAIIRLYENGDRIFLIGFSRGAYTVRSLGGVIAYCGIPRHLPDGTPLQLDLKGSRALAEHAVKDVYQFCSSYERAKIGSYLTFMMRTRDAIAAKFRSEHGSSVIKDGAEQANVFPYFIGVFDTVAALGNKWLGPIVVVAVLAIPFALHYLGAALEPLLPTTGSIARVLGYLSVLLAILIYLKNYLKIAPSLPGYGIFKRLATLHLTRSKHKFYDTTLNVNVGYAKHAISIDEDRADFARVGWIPTADKQDKRDYSGNLYFEQVWFPGVHADVGGGYLENEARLSDDALNWMVAAASIIPDGLKHDGSVLGLWPNSSGPQHDEQAGSFFKKGLRMLPTDDTGVSRSPMHKSVYQRFENGPVMIFNQMGLYRPINLRTHVDFEQYFDPGSGSPGPNPNRSCIADDIEMKWKKTAYVGRI